MPTNRKRTVRNRKNDIVLDETVLEFLRTGNKPDRGTPAWELYTSRFFDDGALIEETRMYYRQKGHLDA